MQANGFALRDAFPDLFKELISKEEAEDTLVSERITNTVNIAYKKELSIQEQIETVSRDIETKTTKPALNDFLNEWTNKVNKRRENNPIHEEKGYRFGC